MEKKEKRKKEKEKEKKRKSRSYTGLISCLGVMGLPFIALIFQDNLVVYSFCWFSFGFYFSIILVALSDESIRKKYFWFR